MTLVLPSGPNPCKWAVVGEAPADEEVRQGRGFVGPSGTMIWPLMRRLAMLDRSEVYVDNLCQHPLDNDLDGDLKLTPVEFDDCMHHLWNRLAEVQPQRILAVGALAARALLGDRYTEMSVCNGIGFAGTGRLEGAVVIPTWHPAAALRPGGEDRLAYTGAAIAAFNPAKRVKLCPTISPHFVPDPWPWEGRAKSLHHLLSPMAKGALGIDTEGTPDDPICMTIANNHQRAYVEAADVAEVLRLIPSDWRLVFHNALWDWPVLRAMGAPADLHTRWAWCDTMELAYLRQTEPKGLKDLAYRHLGIRMRTFDDVVTPHHDEMLQAVARGRIAAGTTLDTHTPKGRLRKKPRVILTDEVKPLKRAIDNPKLLAERMPGLPAATLRLVPEQERVEYATLDAWVTLMVEGHLR